MAWGKFDDRYDDNRKIKRAWRHHPRAVGLHAMSVTYCARHETDGHIDLEWLEEKLPDPEERREVIDTLVRLELYRPNGGEGFEVNDYLEYNPSKDELASLRVARAKAGQKGGRTPRKQPGKRRA